MSTLDDSKYALDSAPAGFNDKERAKWNKGIAASKKRIAAQCKHLIKGEGAWKRPKRKWSSVAWSQYRILSLIVLSFVLNYKKHHHEK